MFKSIIYFLISNLTIGQNSIFYLKEINYFSDLNYYAINQIDSYQVNEISDSVFNMLKGNYTIYRFERFLSSYNPKEKIDTVPNMEIIIMKVHEDSIIETYFYRLNWREPPLSSVLLTSNEKIKLKNKLSTNLFNFKQLNNSGINLLQPSFIKMKLKNNEE